MTKWLEMLCGGLYRSIKFQQRTFPLIKDMYDNVVTSVQTSDRDTNDIPIHI
jgi:hypothetical protein